MAHTDSRNLSTLFLGLSLFLSNCLASQETDPGESLHPAAAIPGLWLFLGAVKRNQIRDVHKTLSLHPEWVHAKFLGMSALHQAVLRNSVECVEILVEVGADINKRDHNQRTALYYAILHHREPLVRYLIEQDAQINIKDSGEITLLDLALSFPDEENIIRLLVQSGVDINAVDTKGRLPLESALASLKRLKSEGSHFEGYSLELICFIITQGSLVNQHMAQTLDKILPHWRQIETAPDILYKAVEPVLPQGLLKTLFSFCGFSWSQAMQRAHITSHKPQLIPFDDM